MNVFIGIAFFIDLFKNWLVNACNNIDQYINLSIEPINLSIEPFIDHESFQEFSDIKHYICVKIIDSLYF